MPAHWTRQWKRKAPTASMLVLLEHVRVCGPNARTYAIARAAKRKTSDVRDSLKALLELELVARGSVRVRSQYLPTYTVTPKGAQYL